MSFFKNTGAGLQYYKPIIDDTFRFFVSSICGGGFSKDFNYIRDKNLDIGFSDDLCEIYVYNIGHVGGFRNIVSINNIKYINQDYVKFVMTKDLLQDMLWIYKETGLTYFAFNRRMNIYLRNRCHWLKGYIYVDFEYNIVIHKIKEQYIPKYLKDKMTFVGELGNNNIDIKNVYKFNNLREIIINNKDNILMHNT